MVIPSKGYLRLSLRLSLRNQPFYSPRPPPSTSLAVPSLGALSFSLTRQGRCNGAYRNAATAGQGDDVGKSPPKSQQPHVRHSKIPAWTDFGPSAGRLGSKLSTVMSIYEFVPHIFLRGPGLSKAPGGGVVIEK